MACISWEALVSGTYLISSVLENNHRYEIVEGHAPSCPINRGRRHRGALQNYERVPPYAIPSKHLLQLVELGSMDFCCAFTAAL
jgi:hypothetical protein